MLVTMFLWLGQYSHVNINAPTAMSTFPRIAGPTYHHTFPILTQHHSHFAHKLTFKPFTPSWTSSMEFAPFVELYDRSSADIDEEFLLKLRTISWLFFVMMMTCFNWIEFFNITSWRNEDILSPTTTLVWMTSSCQQEWYHLYWKIVMDFLF